MNPDWKRYAAGLCFAVAIVALLIDRSKKKG